MTHPAFRILLVLALAAPSAACKTALPPRPGETPLLPDIDAPSQAAKPTYGAFGSAAAPDVKVEALRLTSQPKPGGPTWADLEKDDSARDTFDPEVPVILQADDGYGAGVTAPNGVASVRGKSTRESEQKSYQVALDKTAPAWRGAADILLNKHPYDNSRLRNKLAFDLFRGIPELVVPTASFATLAVDGRDLGFFTQIERVDKRFLKAHGLDPEGALYQAEAFEFQRSEDVLKPADAPGYDKKAFEKQLDIVGGKDHTRLLAMLDAVNDPKVPINATIDHYFDRANYLTWLAVNVVMDNLDTNSQNFFLYAPKGEGPWRFLPWDYDGALGYYDQTGRTHLARWQEGPANWWAVTLHRRFLKDPENVRQLVARIDALADGFFTHERVEGLLSAYRPVVGPAILKAPDGEGAREGSLGPQAAWEAEMQRIPTIFGAARSRFEAALKRPMPIFLGTPTSEAGVTTLVWDESFDLQGDSFSYELTIARDPDLQDVVTTRTGLPAATASVPLPAGTYYWTVVIKDGTGEWQQPFSSWTDPSGKRYDGIKRFVVP